MKLSEAILLGDTLKKCDSNQWLSRDGSCGCALGGALLALGLGDTFMNSRYVFTPIDLPEIKRLYPWLKEEHVCRISGFYGAVEDGEKTLEQLVDYVRSVEPAEESKLPDLPLSEQLRMEEEAAAEEGAAIEASGYPDPAENVRFA